MKEKDRWKGTVHTTESTLPSREDLDLLHKKIIENGLTCYRPLKIRVIYDLNRKDVHLIRDFDIHLATMTTEEYNLITRKH